MGNQNDRPTEIEISNFQKMFQTNNEYDLDIYTHKDISIHKEIKVNYFQKPSFALSDSIIEDFKKNPSSPNEKPRETNCTESMSVRSAGFATGFREDSSEEKNPEIAAKELKCSMCGKKADGVCALCLVTRFCKSCFENKHKNSPFEDDPNNIHKLTLYKKTRKINSPFLRKKIKQGSIVSAGRQAESLSGSSSATLRNTKLSSFFGSMDEKTNEKTTMDG